MSTVSDGEAGGQYRRIPKRQVRSLRGRDRTCELGQLAPAKFILAEEMAGQERHRSRRYESEDDEGVVGGEGCHTESEGCSQPGRDPAVE